MIMSNLKTKSGVSLIELLIVVSVTGAVLLIGASYFSGNVALRRSVDEITNSIGTSLNLAKLKSARQGVEYRLVFADCTNVDSTDPDCDICNTYVDYSTGDETVNLILERGDSNVGSGIWCMQNTQRKMLESTTSNLAMSANVATAPLNISFSPTGMRSDFRADANVETITVVPGVGAVVDKCGEVGVTAAGGLRVYAGRWDGTSCNAILDPAPTPGP